MIREDLSARRAKLFPMLLKAGQHSEIALIQYRTAVSLNVAGASALLPFGSAVLCQGGAGKEQRQNADNGNMDIHGNLSPQQMAMYRRVASKPGAKFRLQFQERTCMNRSAQHRHPISGYLVPAGVGKSTLKDSGPAARPLRPR
jgi:hypothetical protein